jgi:hypothetical protein
MPQVALMKFVRHATKLKWFRSDLTPANVAKLKQELSQQRRPDVTFEA